MNEYRAMLKTNPHTVTPENKSGKILTYADAAFACGFSVTV